jgi:protein-S-isoprenylcysteine O-methyltransferase Ste14
MNSKNVARHFAGYLIGFSLFALAIPYGLIKLSSFHPIHLPMVNAARIALTVILGSIGIVFMLWSNSALLILGKGGPTDAFNIAISPRTKHLVVRGPYRYTRNPMVCGAFSCYFSLAIFRNSLQTVLVLIVFFLVIRFLLQKTEEKRLLKDFGQEYEDYRKSTAMIVPWPTKKRY